MSTHDEPDLVEDDLVDDEIDEEDEAGLSVNALITLGIGMAVVVVFLAVCVPLLI
ncbi:hypothetical protein [Parenemella sanctibonifatiensis]|uniref:hypothetical protein n=1 Tax=Parenemella sanctibonifatiensis TaxID=2016505 RepID=UPI0015C5A474|nr:hypothetical protein [Parenemella sanctibonifatiensis]